MRTIYIDKNHHCHVADDGTMTAVETPFFDGRCDAFVEGYCYEIEKGAIYPYKPYSELDETQRKYERQLLSEYKINQEELNFSYQEGVNSI